MFKLKQTPICRFLGKTLKSLACTTLFLFPLAGIAVGQQDQFKQFNASSIFQQMDAQSTGANTQELVPSWWDKHVADSMRQQQPLPADVHTLLFLALQHSNQIKIAKRDPLIRETAVPEADSRFDWVRYLNTAWNDTSEPIGNTLTAGGTTTRFNDNVFTCLLYTSPSPRDRTRSRMPSSA